jgi:hypothetical protein
MVRAPSWIQRAGVVFVLLATLTSGTIALPHDAADAECIPALVTHDESAHRISAGSTPSAADSGHCFLCHSLRSFYPAFDRFEHSHDAPSAERLYTAATYRARVAAWVLVPGRAPPA